MDFAWLPPEINSARIFAGAGAGPLFAAASAWEALAAELAGSASSFDAVIAGLTGGPWAGPASVSMAAAAAPYVGWLSAAAAQAETAAASAVAAATAFESAVAATVHPAAVAANRVLLGALVATNFLGQNTPAIAATEFDYVEMWAQDVGAMVGYDAGAGAAAAELMPFGVPPLDLAGLASQLGGQLGAQAAGLAATATAAVSPALQGALAGVPGVVAGAQSLASSLPLSSVMQVAQVAAQPASMMLGPLMQLGSTANAGTAGLAGATAWEGLADAPKFVGDVNPMKGLGGGAGVGAGIGADLGKARLVGAMSVPPTWEGSMPKGLSSAAMAGLGGVPTAAELAAAAGGAGTGGMPMMPMPMGAGGAGAGMPGGMMGRGGANPHVVQARPSVIPRTGIG
ncbi:PPE family protein [Mycobacterium pseudokansasii]|uniref:Putative PPE family protein PPE38 n=1 Tax=Mycobacterium pseudokansasii TaxID=2341080 RepID=A0A498QZ54_9MYCO|nr:PPE family protein [Mycobacterium pseudokansasii]VBA55929.1 putative PPE family protein PPE38 [Mycobacterium pseudokansasii]